MPINPSEAGKGDGRRKEDGAKVEANWPTDWNARDRERRERERDAGREQVAE